MERIEKVLRLTVVVLQIVLMIVEIIERVLKLFGL